MTKPLSRKSQLREQKPNNAEERRMCGLNACLARFKNQPTSIIRAYVTKERLPEAKAMLSYLAEHKRAYHVVDSETLAKIFGTSHHEGLGLLIRDFVSTKAGDYLSLIEKAIQKKDACSLMVLDGVDNPHNLGAIARVAAHFGCVGIWSGGHDDENLCTDPFQASFFRTAQGGAESLVKGFASRRETVELCRRLKKLGFSIYGTSSRSELKPKSIYGVQFRERRAFVLGSESLGISSEIVRQCDDLLLIPGSGSVESLNVACAASVVLGEDQRQSSIIPRPTHKL